MQWLLLLRCYAGISTWEKSKGSYTNTILQNFKEKLQEIIEERTGIQWDKADPTGKGGTSTTGNIARRLLHDERNVLISVLSERHKPLFQMWGQLLSVIVRVVSSKGVVNVKRYQAVSTELYIFICDNFPWVSITPSVHKLLGHTWELISENDGHGLGNLDESGLEACNKLIRKFRTSLARKSSQMDNLTDVIRRLWVNTDPLINLERQKTLSFCKECNIRGHSTRYCIAKKDITDDALITYLTSWIPFYSSLCVFT